MPREVSAVALGTAAVLVLTLVAVVTLRNAEVAEDRQRIERAAEDVARTIETELDWIADLAQDVAVATALVEIWTPAATRSCSPCCGSSRASPP